MVGLLPRRHAELSPQPAVARRQLARLLADSPWRGDVDAVVLAVHEAMVNAQRHGGGMTGACAGFEGGDLVVEVSDRGMGFDLPASVALPDRGAEQGRGLFLIRKLASEVRVVGRGPGVRLVLRFASRGRRDGSGAPLLP